MSRRPRRRQQPGQPSGPSPSPLRERILKLLRDPRYQPLDKVELTRKLGLSSDDRAQLRDLLRTLEQEGVVARIRKDRYVLPGEANLCTGILRVSRGGNARLDCGVEPHIFVSTENAGVAMNGDRVVARLIHEGRRQRPDPQGRASAEVIRILERANETIVGTLQSSKRFFFVVPDDSRIPHNIYVLPDRDLGPQTPDIGDKVVVRLEEWTHARDQSRRPHHRGPRPRRRPRRRHALDHPAQQPAHRLSRAGARRGRARPGDRRCPRRRAARGLARRAASSPSIPTMPGISTMPSTSSASPAAAGASASTSRMSPITSAPAAPSTARRSRAATASTSPTASSRCSRSASATAFAASSPSSTASLFPSSSIFPPRAKSGMSASPAPSSTARPALLTSRPSPS